MKYEKGMVVKYADGWYEPGEESERFVILEAFDDVERCKAASLTARNAFGHVKTLWYEMITPAEQ